MSKANQIADVSTTAQPATSSPIVPVRNDPNSYQSQPSTSPNLDLLHPVFSNLPFIDGIAKQAAVLSASTGSETYGTLSAASHNPKPFIIGFIVPDVPVNYLPTFQAKSGLTKKNTNSKNKQPGGNGSSGAGVPNIGTGSGPNPVPKKWTKFSSSSLKQAIIASVKNRTGKDPDERTVAMIYGQFALESGHKGGPDFGCFNYNLGNYHGGGGKTNLDSKPVDNQVLPAPPSNPTFRSVYLGYDKTPSKTGGDPQYYSTYFQSFNNLNQGVDSQIGQLFRNWPGTATATTPEEYNQALSPKQHGISSSHGDYYEANKDNYLGGIKNRMNLYYSDGGQPIPSSDGISSSSSDSVSDGIMKNGDVCESDVNVLSSKYKVGVDSSRVIASDAYLKTILDDIEALRKTPPLLMLVNPSSFDRSYQHSIDSSVKTRSGHVVHMWLERPMSISCSGVTAGQYTFSIDGAGGLTQTNRVQSISYQNLLSLVFSYKNNGVIYDRFSKTSLGVPIMACSIYIYYDNHMYIGSFDDFSVDDAADKPHQMSYSFKFNVRYDIEITVSDSSITSQIGF